MAKSMKMEIALIVGIVFFCCWCAYIIIKMIMSQENMQTTQIHQQHQFPFQHHPAFQNLHQQQQYAQIHRQNVNSNQNSQLKYLQSNADSIDTPQAVSMNALAAPTASLQIESHFPSQMIKQQQQQQQQQQNQLIIEDLQRQRQAEATSPHWQVVLPGQHVKNVHKPLNFNGNVQQQPQWAIPMENNRHQQHSHESNELVSWSPRAALQAQPPDRRWRTLQKPMANQMEKTSAHSGDSDPGEQETIDSYRAANSAPSDENNNSDDPDPDPDPDTETDPNSDAHASSQQANDNESQQPQQDEQDEQRAARRSFSESEEEATERDSRGRPILSHRSHLINGKPAQSEEQIRAAQDAGARKFDSIVSEIEQTEPSSPEYDENEPQEAVAQQGDESRLVNRKIGPPKEAPENHGNSEDSKVSSGDVGHDDGAMSADSEPKSKKEKHNHKLKESLTAKQWDDSRGSEPSGHSEHDQEDLSDSSKEENEPEVAREKMEQESRDDHVDFADLDLLNDPNDFPFMSTSTAFDSTLAPARRPRRNADPIDLDPNGERNEPTSAGLRSALLDVIGRIEQNNSTSLKNATSPPARDMSFLPEVELQAPPSDQSASTLSENEDEKSAISDHLNAEERQDFTQQPNGHFYAPEPYHNHSSFYTNLTQDQAGNNLTAHYPTEATIGLTALSQAQANHSQLQPESQYYSSGAPQMPTPLPMINYNTINHNNDLAPPEYQSHPQNWPTQPPALINYQNNPSDLVSVYPNYEMRPSPLPLGSKAYSHTKKKKKKKKLLLEKDEKSVKKKKKKKKLAQKVTKGKSYKKKIAAHKGAMKKRKQKAAKKMSKGYKEFKGATRGHKGKKGVGERGAKKGTLLYKDKGYKKRGFKKAYQKLESGDHKTYFDEFRDKDHKKKWKDFKDKHQFSQNKKWAAKDKKQFDHHKLDELKDKKSKSGAWNKKSMSKHKKHYKLKGQYSEKAKAKRKKKKMSQKKKKKKKKEEEKYLKNHH